MSLNDVPSKEEVTGWSPQSLAGYMSRIKLSGCDKVVMKGNITGAQFTQMTDCDLQLFPCLYIPILAKIQRDINKSGQKPAFDKCKTQKYPKQGTAQEEEAWDSDNGSDQICEGPCRKEKYSHVYALTEQQHISDPCEGDDTKPFSADTRKPPRHPRDGQHRDPVQNQAPAERTLLSPNPHPRETTYTPLRPFKAAARQPALHIDRTKKQSVPTHRDITTSKGGAVKAPGSSPYTVRTHKLTDVVHRGEKQSPAPAASTHVDNSTPGQRKDLDPSWYGGNLTRRQAEVALREMNEDGAFVVRDSTKGSDEHPYTLMLLKDGKVYNIKIRNQGNCYVLGTGSNTTKSFPGVKEMITHHAHTPLLLIDATDHSSTAQRQCCLLHPAGL